MFNENVRGRRANVLDSNQEHDGKYGYWLERQFGIIANGNNAPDLYGYELKNQTISKTTFGDWSANYYIYKNCEFSDVFTAKAILGKRDIFLSIFGQNVNGRYSWSGSPCPNVKGYNYFGQTLVITADDDIMAIYSYSKDQRSNKFEIVPYKFRVDNLILAIWNNNSLKQRVECKFNQNGWFTCKKDNTGLYTEICFGEPISYKKWIWLVRNGIVFFDSAMHQGNSRPYSLWRANNNFWDSLIVERY